MSKPNAIAVFCGARSGAKHQWKELAFDLGTEIAKRGITLVYGGGKVGLMGELAKGARESGGKIIGVIPTFLSTVEIKDTEVAELIEVKDMSERKTVLEQKADAFAILPGGIGTLDEFSEMITGFQLDMHAKPTYIINEHNFYDGLIKQLKTYLDEGFIDEKTYQSLKIFPTLNDFAKFLDSI